MRFFAIYILMLSLVPILGQAKKHFNLPSSMTLFDFDTEEGASWQVVNDGVMGGRSQGYVKIDNGLLQFAGTLVTRGGGFTSVRANLDADLSDYDGLELLVRGNGRTYEVEVDDDSRRLRRSVSRRGAFATSEEWTWVRVPFDSLRTTIFGQAVVAKSIDLMNIQSIGLYILDGIDGPFSLEVDLIRTYKDDDD